jgi:EAL and modified HD-GYP domain-containing signal transduction protein
VAQAGDDVGLAATATAKLQLLRELANPDCEMDELAAIIASDISLSYRMLRYINSASFGLRNKIKSIQQAVSLLGLNEIRHWATVVAMTDLDSTPKGEELAYMALQRGRFLSKLAGTIKGFSHSSSTMFMLGLFSLLDALLSYPMDKALDNVPLDDEIKAALCGTLNEFRDWLLMVEAVELGNWAIANEILGRYGACFTQAATQYMKASAWASSQLHNMHK